jgi:hypothetical protein
MNSLERNTGRSTAARALLALLTLIALGGSGAAAVGTTAGAEAPASGAATLSARTRVRGMERLTATVKAVNLREGTMDLVTGVGLALRIRRVQLPAPLRVKGAAPESAAAVLVPGCLVRIECAPTPAGTAASTVELLRAAPRGVKP